MRAVLMRVAIGLIFASAKSAFAYECVTHLAHLITNVPSLVVPRDLPVGSEIGAVVVNHMYPYECKDTYPFFTRQDFGIMAYGMHVATFNGRRIYGTNVKGIGYAIGGEFPACRTRVYWVSGRNTENPNQEMMCSINGMFEAQPMSARLYIQFYKTAEETGTGRVTPRDMVAFVLKNNSTTWTSPVSYLSINGFQVNEASCTLGSKSINVDMGNIHVRAFGGPGSWPTDGNTRAFSIPLQCPGGVAVSFQIDGNAKDPARGLLNLSADASAAKGIALQVLYDDQPLTLGSRVKWQTTSADGNYAIPLKARYLQTDASVTPGVANAAATFTVSYQ
ncbi:hypothetical protein R20233_01220 [Ralstonia sp. LMG 32965]|uniref:fimbrial protein n=1 Tax=Ralstonia flatus TaxID=3058601 RepID=UPI0028F6A2F7|nr:fimbrial protein [Ralstonia sp. LMG 32965]CAJ0865335.1 hypothetical protein R20233_01220 [Ralstonia sp. LMG 32965]